MNKNFFKALGPGLIWAGASVGVSHLVQSTRAGANFGFQLIWLVLVINLIKYPFFEFAPRYAAATGKSLLHGYRHMGRWAIILYLVITISTMFTLQAAITSVTTGLIQSIFPNILPFMVWAVILIALCVLIIILGKYKTLDGLVKGIIVILALTTIAAVLIAFSNGFNPDPVDQGAFTWSNSDILFLVALAGWMPSAIDVSVWHSVWTVTKAKSTGYKPKVREALLDFNIGYLGTAILAIFFLSLGALVMFGKGESFPASSVGFADTLLHMYTRVIGSWAYPIIAVAALATMFSTTLTVLDAYPRVLSEAIILLKKEKPDKHRKNFLSYASMFILVSGTLIVLFFFMEQLKVLVDMATSLSFIVAPILAYLNYNAVISYEVPANYRPGVPLRTLSLFGIMFLSAFAVYYLVVRLGILQL